MGLHLGVFARSLTMALPPGSVKFLNLPTPGRRVRLGVVVADGRVVTAAHAL